MTDKEFINSFIKKQANFIENDPTISSIDPYLNLIGGALLGGGSIYGAYKTKEYMDNITKYNKMLSDTLNVTKDLSLLEKTISAGGKALGGAALLGGLYQSRNLLPNSLYQNDKGLLSQYFNKAKENLSLSQAASELEKNRQMFFLGKGKEIISDFLKKYLKGV